MPTADLTALDAPQKVYLFPSATYSIAAGGGQEAASQDSALFFQYWPGSLSDEYAVNYAEHVIPGGSHPLYQWTGGGGRTLSFEAIFVSELNTERGSSTLSGATAALANASIHLLPSSPHTVNVSAALARLRSWMLPAYPMGGQGGATKPPPILTLVFPNTKLAGTHDLLQVILRSAPVTIEAWYPNGQIRVATVTLTFNEVVQSASGGGQSNATRVKFIGRDDFESEGKKYRHRGIADSTYVGGGI
jgi:hypothetical protein